MEFPGRILQGYGAPGTILRQFAGINLNVFGFCCSTYALCEKMFVIWDVSHSPLPC
jgi:hypothetical protein